MVRHLLLTSLLATSACGFTAGNGTAGDDVVAPGDDTQNPPPVERKCTLADSALRLCIDFDDDQMLTSDGSGLGHDAIGTGYMVTTRKTEQAVMVDASTHLLVAETPDLDIQTSLTVTLMAQPTSYPATGQAYWALDNNKQYFISYQHDGKFRCGIGNMVVDSSLPMQKDSWYQIACTYDRGKLRLFIEGQLAGCRAVPAIPIDGTEGLAIGGNIGAGGVFSEQFIGGLDNIQVFARAYTMDEVCTAAGKTDCWQGWGGQGGIGGHGGIEGANDCD